MIIYELGAGGIRRPLPGISSFEGTERLGYGGDWTATLLGQVTIPDWAEIVVVDNQEIVWSGFVVTSERTTDASGTVTTLYGVDWLWVWLADYVSPEPASTPPFTASSHWVGNGDPVEFLGELLSDQRGQTAHASRQIGTVTWTPNGAPAISRQFRFGSLAETVRLLCTAYGLAVRVDRDQIEVVSSEDSTVSLTYGDSRITSWNETQKASLTTDVLGLGSGELTARLQSEVPVPGTSAPFRLATVYDANGIDNLAELDQQAIESIETGETAVSVTATISDNVNLGDRFQLISPSGAATTDRVTQILKKYEDQSSTREVTVGVGTPKGREVLAASLRPLFQRIYRQEGR